MTGRRDAAGPRFADMSLTQNGLLTSIGLEVRNELGVAGTMVELRLGNPLRRKGQRAEHVWFPVSGMVSLSVPLQDDTTVEAGLVG